MADGGSEGLDEDDIVIDDGNRTYRQGDHDMFCQKKKIVVVRSCLQYRPIDRSHASSINVTDLLFIFLQHSTFDVDRFESVYLRLLKLSGADATLKHDVELCECSTSGLGNAEVCVDD